MSLLKALAESDREREAPAAVELRLRSAFRKKYSASEVALFRAAAAAALVAVFHAPAQAANSAASG